VHGLAPFEAGRLGAGEFGPVLRLLAPDSFGYAALQHNREALALHGAKSPDQQSCGGDAKEAPLDRGREPWFALAESGNSAEEIVDPLQ